MDLPGVPARLASPMPPLRDISTLGFGQIAGFLPRGSEDAGVRAGLAFLQARRARLPMAYCKGLPDFLPRGGCYADARRPLAFL